jgi:hypothetical protein
MAFIRGGSTFVLAGAHNLSPYTNNVSVSMDGGLVEDTTFGSEVRTFEPGGTRSATAAISGFFDETTYLAQNYGSGSDDAMSDRVSTGPAGLMSLTNTLQATPGYAPLTFVWGGNTALNPCFVGTILQASYEIGDTVGELISFSGNFECGAGYEVVAATVAKASTQKAGFGRGFLLAPLASYNSAAFQVGSTHDAGADVGSLGGVIANMHCSLSGTAGNGTFKIQHSPNNATWYDLAIFTNITTTTGPFGQSLETGAMGAVYRYVRAFQTASMTGDQTIAISFARTGETATQLAGQSVTAVGSFGITHDATAGSSAGATGVLMVHSATGAGTGTVILQHSTDNFAISVVTLGTFTTAITSATINASETIRVAGAVHRYVRANATAIPATNMVVGVFYDRN